MVLALGVVGSKWSDSRCILKMARTDWLSDWTWDTRGRVAKEAAKTEKTVGGVVLGVGRKTYYWGHFKFEEPVRLASQDVQLAVNSRKGFG